MTFKRQLDNLSVSIRDFGLALYQNLFDEENTDGASSTAQIDTAKSEFSSFAPPHHEHIVRAKLNDITHTIAEIIKKDMDDVKWNHAKQGKYFEYLPETEYHINPQVLENGRYAIFIYECFYNNGEEPKRLEPLGYRIQFEFTEYKLSNTIKIEAICYSENALIGEYFESLWKKLNKHFPDVQEVMYEEKPLNDRIRRETLSINLALRTTYREFVDWFEKGYPDIKLEYHTDNVIVLIFKNSIGFQAELAIEKDGENIKIEGLCSCYDSGKWLQIFEQRCKNYFGEAGQIEAEQIGETAKSEIELEDKKPNLRTQERFAVFQRLKTEHPTWSQSKVAMESISELNESITAETVRNTYRLMREKWERGDRIR